MNYKVKFSGRSLDIDLNEINKIGKKLNKSNTLTQGVFLQKFENDFANFTKISNTLAVSSATAGFELIANFMNYKKGDNIIIPSHTYTSTAYPFVKQGFKIKWADIDLETRTVSIDSIISSIDHKTKAIVVVHLYGYGVSVKKLKQICKSQKILLIEDCAQAMGVTVDNKHVGLDADFSIFSFHSHKNISTLGEGGMIGFKNKSIRDLFVTMRHNGHSPFVFEKKYPWMPAMTNVDLPRYNNENIMPSNFCLGEFQCAYGSFMLKKINNINLHKRKRAITFINNFKKFDFIKFHLINTKRHNYHLLVAELKHDLRDKVMLDLNFKHKIQVVAQYYPLHLYDFYKKTNNYKANCPNTEKFYFNMISFPFNSHLPDKDISYMTEKTYSTLKHYSTFN